MASHTGKIDMIRGSIIKSAALFACRSVWAISCSSFTARWIPLWWAISVIPPRWRRWAPPHSPMEILLCVFLGIGNGASILVSQEMGRRNADGLRMLVHTAVWFLYLCAIPVTILAMFVGPALLRLMQVPADAFDYAVLYLRITALGTLGNLGYNMNAGILRGLGGQPVHLAVAADLLPDQYCAGCCLCGGAGHGCGRCGAGNYHCAVSFLAGQHPVRPPQLRGFAISSAAPWL